MKGGENVFSFLRKREEKRSRGRLLSRPSVKVREERNATSSSSHSKMWKKREDGVGGKKEARRSVVRPRTKGRGTSLSQLD